MVIVRPFRPDDLDGVVYISKISLREEYEMNIFLSIYKAWNSCFLVAITRGKVIGFINGITDPEQGGRILMLAVHPNFRNIGVGGNLLEQFTNVAVMNGVGNIQLEVRESNNDALEFYRKRGFHVVSKIGDFYTDGEDGIKMMKRI
ncbi:MAG: GNAT family N-acetyltransferase [Thermoplasmata archaeon]